ncbi:hypothetical protein C8Q74DRAFT_1364425 [Fomes fomentarius]|nr:hypothetical protein C8Q74DRAFT_1364425 [Fomes fomentarius]
MAGVLDNFSDLFPPFFDSPTVVISIDTLSLNTDILTTSTASPTPTFTPTPKPISSSNTPLKTSSDALPTRTITHTETHSLSASEPDTSALPEVNPTITVQHNVTATLTQTSVLTSSAGPTSVQSFAHSNRAALSSSATVGITIAIVAGVLLVLSLVLFLLYKRRRRRAQQRDAEMRPQISWPMALQASPTVRSTWTTDTKGRYRTLSLTTSLTAARSPGPLSPILETEPSTPLSPGSDPRLCLVGAGPLMRPATIYARPVHIHLPQIRREVDAGYVMHSQLEDGYRHEHYEGDGSEVVEPLPPAYDDLPPRGRPEGSIPANRDFVSDTDLPL